jgi:glutathione S-transferase
MLSAMRTLYHLPLLPACRKIRLALTEKGLEFELKQESIWDRRPEFLALNPAGELPVLVEEDGTVLPHAAVISEWLEEQYPKSALLGTDAVQRAETRRLVLWFDEKFNAEVTSRLAGEKAWKRIAGAGAPDAANIRAGKANIDYHLDYISWLADRRNWLAGEELSLADLAAAAHLSVLDYLGDVPWDKWPEAKSWYQRIKSRPSFRPLLADRPAGLRPAEHYADLDF